MPQQNTLNLKLLFRQILAYTPGKLIPALEGVLFIGIFTRLFSAADFGKYSLVLSTCTLVSVLISEWLQQSINRFLSTASDHKEAADHKRAISLSFFGIIGLMLILALLFFFLQNFYQDWRIFFFPGVSLLIGLSLYNPLTVILQAEMKPKAFSLVNISQATLKLGFCLLFVFCFQRHISLLIWGLALSSLVFVPFLWSFTDLPFGTLFTSPALLTNQKPRIVTYLSYGLPMSGWFLSSVLLNVGDHYVIQWFRGAGELGIYSANYKIIQSGVGFLVAPILLAAHPFLMKSYSQCDAQQLTHWLNKIIEWFLIIGIIAVGAMWFMGKELAVLFLGPEFQAGHTIMPMVLLGYVFWQIGMYTHKPLEFKKQTMLMFKLSLIAALINLILNIIFVPLYGYQAAATTTMVSFLIYAIVTAYYGRCLTNWNINWCALIAIALTVFLFFNICNNIMSNNGLNFYLQISLKIILCIIIFIFIISAYLYLNKLKKYNKS